MNPMPWTAPAAGHMQVSTRGLDLAKDVFQVRGIDANENGSKSSSDANLFVFWLQNSIWPAGTSLFGPNQCND